MSPREVGADDWSGSARPVSQISRDFSATADTSRTGSTFEDLRWIGSLISVTNFNVYLWMLGVFWKASTFFKVKHAVVFHLIMMQWQTTQLSPYVFHLCSMFLPNNRSSSGTTNCIKYKRAYIKTCHIRIEISVVQLFFIMYYMYGFYKNSS